LGHKGISIAASCVPFFDFVFTELILLIVSLEERRGVPLTLYGIFVGLSKWAVFLFLGGVSMQSFFIAEQLINNLEGRSCIISRKHCPKEIVRPDNFFTLHQLVYKVLKVSAGRFELSGELMIKYVGLALRDIFKTVPPMEKVLTYYYLIREHKNSLSKISELPKGLEVLSHYQKSIAEGMDWEDSLQSASWLLKKGYVNSLYHFQFDNIILVQPQLLGEKKNKNALEFFLALSNWMEDYTRNEVFTVNNQGVVMKFNQGNFEVIHIMSDLSKQG
jgi:hypothetical protein